jgi:hypothetical protein
VVDVEKSEMERKIREEADFIHAPKVGNSLNKLLAKIDNPLKNVAIGRLLLISEKEVEEIYEESVIELRKGMVSNENKE